MRIAILARNHNLYSHKRLYEVGCARGHDMIKINTLDCYMNISAKKASIFNRDGSEIIDIDAVIPRIGASITFYGTAVVRQFETMGVFTLNSSTAISRSRDKLRSLQIMARKRINMPITGFAHSNLNKVDLINMVGGIPIIVKLLEGTQGKGVMIAESKKAAGSLINTFNDLNTDILVQEFIKEAGGMDIRCFVIGDKVVAAMKRQAKEDEFRSNIHLGGLASEIKITSEERQIAIKATKSLGLNVAGVDIIRSDRGPLVLEVNSSPGLEGIENMTKKDIATKIIRFIEKKISVSQNG